MKETSLTMSKLLLTIDFDEFKSKEIIEAVRMALELEYDEKFTRYNIKRFERMYCK